MGHHRWFCNQFSPFFPALHCPLGLAKLQACPYPDVVFPPLPLSALSSSPFHCALQDGFGQTWWTFPLQILIKLEYLFSLRKLRKLHIVGVFFWTSVLEEYVRMMSASNSTLTVQQLSHGSLGRVCVFIMSVFVCVWESACVYVCVRERERVCVCVCVLGWGGVCLPHNHEGWVNTWRKQIFWIWYNLQDAMWLPSWQGNWRWSSNMPHEKWVCCRHKKRKADEELYKIFCVF